MGQIQFTVSLIMIGLFSIALIGFAANFANDNNSHIDIRDDDELPGLESDLETSTKGFREDSQDTYESIVDSSIDEGQTTPSGGQFAITPVGIIGSVKNILQVGYIKIFGAGGGFGIFITTFISVIGFIFGLYLWKTWAGRNPN